MQKKRESGLPAFILELCQLFCDDTVEELLLQDERVHCMKNTSDSWCETSIKICPSSWLRPLQMFAAENFLRLDPLSPTAGGGFSAAGNYYRWQAVLPPLAGEALFSLRRHRFRSLDLSSFSAHESHTALIEAAMLEKKSIFICGGTGSGKTSLLNALLQQYCRTERVVILEDVRELDISAPLWTSLSALQSSAIYSLSDCFAATLRLRPQRIVVGELRGKELEVLLQAMASGHNGVLTTLHVGPEDTVLKRLQQLLTHQTSSAFDLGSLQTALRIDMNRRNIISAGPMRPSHS